MRSRNARPRAAIVSQWSAANCNDRRTTEYIGDHFAAVSATVTTHPTGLGRSEAPQREAGRPAVTCRIDV